MADYIYLLENRLSPAQQRALSTVRNLVRAKDLTLFLTGGAVRDLTSGASVRDLDFTVQGNISFLRKDLEAAGAIFEGKDPHAPTEFYRLPGTVRVELSSAMSVTYPKPGKPHYELSNIAEDLRRRDFTANAMALSLNEGSYGLLMDPLNGVADIENRELRLISNYGFLEDPSRMIRAARLSSRLGWLMEEKTQQRYMNAKDEDLTGAIDKYRLGYELEEIFHEEDPLRIMRALDGEGWLKLLAPEMILGKANESTLIELRERQGQLQTQGILSDGAALAFPLIVAKLPAKDVEALKKRFARPGFSSEIDGLEERTRELQTSLAGKEAGTPSVAWRMLHEAEANLVLSMFHTSKSGTIQSRIKTFLNDSPGARQRLPYALLLEMRITPDLPIYHDLLDKLFFQLMDGKLETTEELKAFLEPYSPPAPPPPLNLRRARAKKEPRASRAKAKRPAATVVEQEEAVGVAEGLMEAGTLTGPNRGTEPTTSEVLAGSVAPLAKEENGTESAKPIKASKVTKSRIETLPEMTEVGSSAALKLSTKPSPAPEEKSLKPHPLVSRDVAKAAAVLIPQQLPKTGKREPSTPVKDRVTVSAPTRKAAKANSAPANKKVAAVKKSDTAKNGASKTSSKSQQKTATRVRRSQPAAAPAKKGAQFQTRQMPGSGVNPIHKLAASAMVKANITKPPKKTTTPAKGKANVAVKAGGKSKKAVPKRVIKPAAKASPSAKSLKARISAKAAGKAVTLVRKLTKPAKKR